MPSHLNENNNNNNNEFINNLISSSSSSFNSTSSFIISSLELIFSSVPITLLFILITTSLIYMFAVIYRNLRFIFVHWIRKPHDLRKRYGTGSWVCITGSSTGIGLGFAVEFAKLGFNIILMSRSDENLQKAKLEVIEAGREHGFDNTQVRTVVIDFSEGSNIEFWKERFLKPIDDLDIAVLVNNVGMNHTDNFENIDEKILLDFVSVNCTSQMMATRMLIKKLIARTKSTTTSCKNDDDDNGHDEEEETQKRSAIISISSVAGQRPLLYLAPYSGTKSFNDVFSRSLSLEYASYEEKETSAGSNKTSSSSSVNFFSDLSSYLPGTITQSSSRIDVLSCRPGYVVSNMSQLTEAGGFVLDRYECARGCMEKLGFVTETYGDFRHALYCISYQWIPEFWLRRIRQGRLEAKKAKLAMREQEKKAKK